MCASAPGNNKLSEPVCFIDNISFNNIKVEDIVNSLQLRKEGARQVEYFGRYAYTYGKISHPPKSYPDTAFFNQIFENIKTIDPLFSKENFSCMINYYENGRSFIKQHADNEWSIDPNSNIYTVSLGSPRTIKYINIKGPLDIRTHKLEHGSLNIMSAKSQNEWTHGIEAENDIIEPRVSLTFRHNTDSPPPVKTRAPPVRKPTTSSAEQVLKPPCAPPGVCDKDSKRLLFLTDSILNGYQPHMFKDLVGHTCIKKTNFDLVNFYNFKDEFKYSDIVVLSGGINDLARNGHSAESLADIFFDRLDKCSRDYPNTKFVVNSIIMTKQRHLNIDSDRFNSYVRNFCENYENILFFDSDSFMLDHHHKLDNQIYDDRDVNGIHVTVRTCRLIGGQLVRFIKKTCTFSHSRYSCSPFARNFRSVG